jgi:hypothetical protein
MLFMSFGVSVPFAPCTASSRARCNRSPASLKALSVAVIQDMLLSIVRKNVSPAAMSDVYWSVRATAAGSSEGRVSRLPLVMLSCRLSSRSRLFRMLRMVVSEII